MMILFFFFKQKTAYEMRISDWSSDVALPICRDLRGLVQPAGKAVRGRSHRFPSPERRRLSGPPRAGRSHRAGSDGLGGTYCRRGGKPPHPRSEEHTSELQSLLRISYAVFCLKKKNNKHSSTTLITTTYTM